MGVSHNQHCIICAADHTQHERGHNRLETALPQTVHLMRWRKKYISRQKIRMEVMRLSAKSCSWNGEILAAADSV